MLFMEVRKWDGSELDSAPNLGMDSNKICRIMLSPGRLQFCKVQVIACTQGGYLERSGVRGVVSSQN